MAHERYHIGKGSDNPYDPQVGEAAKMNAQTAKESLDFSKEYFGKYVGPMLDQMTASSAKNQERLDQLFSLNMDQTKQAQQRYNQYGIPAEDRYFKMANDYSGKAEEERQAGLALGDVRSAEANQRAQMGRQLGSLGISATSPAAIAAMADMAVQGGAQEASAKNRARMAAKAMGMQLTGDAANFGRGGQSAVLNFGNAAGGNAGQSFGISSGALAGANSGASVPMQGYGMALQGYGNNLNAYTSLSKNAMDAQAQDQAGFGQFLGTVTSAAIAASDRRLKRDVVKIGAKDGLNVYRFRYLHSDRPLIGYMADEVLPVKPEAVHYDANGYMMLDYSMLPSLGA